jgi:murein L,D-transpeptidase YcbB/YkuD
MPPYRRGSARARSLAVLLAGFCWLVLAGTPLAGQPAAPQATLPQRVQLILRTRIPASGKAPELRFPDGTAARANPGLPCFYERRDFVPAWIMDSGLRPGVDELLEALAEAANDGLRPEDYHLASLRQQAAQARSRPLIQGNLGDLAELDLQLTDAFLRLGADLRYGRVNPELIYSDCDLDIPEVDLPAVLESALAAGDVREAIADLAPPHEGYRALKKALAQYRETAARGAWPAVPAGPTLKPGEKSERVAALRARLEASGDLQPQTPEKDLFDAPLEAAVKAFQEKHGLDPDGAVGPGTLEALNATAADRVRQIEINLDRWRWLPRDLGERHVIVNIAGFSLDVVEAGTPLLSMRVVAGKPTNRTPMFSGTMTSIVLNPYWNVPPGILKNEVLPRLARDPGYLKRQNMERVPGGGVRQRPGPNNALGKVKFLFPNRFNVYLHDTPSRSLFSRAVRTFSHGCIRVEKPLDLAEYLLKDDPAWTREKLEKVMGGDRKERWVPIPKPLPVHLVYWTAWVDAAGVTQFRKDVYGRDTPLYTATSEPSARKAEEGSPDKGPAKRSP